MNELIEHEGIVRAVAGGKATIEVRTGGCGSCSHQSGCGLGRLAGSKDTAVMTVPVDETVQPGAHVVMTLSQGRMLRAFLLAYLLPATMLLLGAGLAFQHFGSDVATALGAVAGLMLALLLTRAVPGWMPIPQVRLASTPGDR